MARALHWPGVHLNTPGTLGELFERIATGHAVDGMEALAPVLVDSLELLIDVLPADTQILLSDPERIRARAQELVVTSDEFLRASWAAAAEGGKAPIDLGASAYRSLADVRASALALGQSWWSLSPFSAGEADDAGEVSAADVSAVLSRTVPAVEAPVWRGDTEAAVASIRASVAAGHRTILVADSSGLAARMVEILKGADIVARRTGWTPLPRSPPW